MVITPQTDLYLLKTPIEIDNVNQLTFRNAAEQFAYFSSLPKVGRDDFTYQRHDGVIRFPAQIDQIIGFNYVMYRNDAYSDKWFYAFITDMSYVNDGMTEIAITTDVWQTWQFDLNWKQSFVEREHVNSDVPGEHTLPENLDTGEYQIVDQRYSTLSDSWFWCFAVTTLPQGNTEIAGSEKNIGGVFNSLYFFAAISLDAARQVIDVYNSGPGVTADAIVNIYPIPASCVKSDTTVLIGNGVSAPVRAIDDLWTSEILSIQQPDKLAGEYVPKNKKLFAWPFSYFYASNQVGSDVTYHWEDFTLESGTATTGRTAKYLKSIVPSSGISAKLYFTNYKDAKNTTESFQNMPYNNGINFAKTPVCAWTTDYFTNWLTQNGVNVGLSIASSAIAAGVGIATGGVGLAIGANTATSIAGTLASVYQASITPDQANGDVNTGDVMFGLTRNIIKFYMMSVRPERARIIDDYFTMYGYKVSSLKVPNLTGRRNWNYVKTIGCNITADIPQDDLDAIKQMFDNGITLWHNSATFLDYSQNNDII